MFRINSKNIKLKLSVFLMLIVFISACEKEGKLDETSNSINYENGILEFKDTQDLQRTIKSLSAMSNTEYIEWQKNQNFVSVRTKLDSIYHLFDNEKHVNEEEYINEIAEDNKKWVEFVVDEYGEKCLYPIVKDNDYASILNSDGICIVGDKVLKVIGDYKIMAPMSELNNVIATNSIEGIGKNNKWEVERYMYPVSRAMRSTTDNNPTDELQTSTTYKNSSCSKARRCFIQMVLLHNLDGSEHTIQLRTRLTSERKYACVWVHYWTGLSGQNISCRAKVHSAGDNEWKINEIGPFPITEQGDNWSVQRTWDCIVFDDNTLDCNDPFFLEAYGEATSRGVNGQWAIIDYEY